MIRPNSVTSIGSNALSGCSYLTKLTLPFIGDTLNSTKCLGYIFGTTDPSKQSSYVPYLLDTVVITKATSIPYEAFYRCAEINNIILPDSVTTIGGYAFSGCSSLTSIDIPGKVTM